MKKKDLYFSLYIKNALENDIEIKGTFNDIKELQEYFNKSKSYLYSLGIAKQKGLRLDIIVDNINYCLIVDHD